MSVPLYPSIAFTEGLDQATEALLCENTTQAYQVIFCLMAHSKAGSEIHSDFAQALHTLKFSQRETGIVEAIEILHDICYKVINVHQDAV